MSGKGVGVNSPTLAIPDGGLEIVAVFSGMERGRGGAAGGGAF